MTNALWCQHVGNRARCLPCFQFDVLALCRDHQGMSAHMLAEAIADLCGVDLRTEAREETEQQAWPVMCSGCGKPLSHCLQLAGRCCGACDHRSVEHPCPAYVDGDHRIGPYFDVERQEHRVECVCGWSRKQPPNPGMPTRHSAPRPS